MARASELSSANTFLLGSLEPGSVGGPQCTGALSACTPEELEALEGYVACVVDANPTSLSAACLKALE